MSRILLLIIPETYLESAPCFVDLVRFTVCGGQIFKETRWEPWKKEKLTSQPNA